MSELRPREMNLITGELDPQQYVQRTSLAADKQVLPLVLFCFLLLSPLVVVVVCHVI